MKVCECGCNRPTPIAKKTYSKKGHVKGQPLRFISGHNGIRHGNAREGNVTPAYESYMHAKKRCTNPRSDNWNLYGGRGIRFLFTWFEQFYAELGPRPEGMTLDRINVDGHYERGNVRWATASEQAYNRRKKAA